MVGGNYFKQRELEGHSPEAGPAWQFQEQKAEEQSSRKVACDKDSKGEMPGPVGSGSPQEVIQMLIFGAGHRVEYSTIKAIAVNGNFWSVTQGEQSLLVGCYSSCLHSEVSPPQGTQFCWDAERQCIGK